MPSFLNAPDRTLVISTDPAHSLGDALDQDISGGEPVRVMGLDNLSAMEVSFLSSVRVDSTANMIYLHVRFCERDGCAGRAMHL